MMSPFFFAFFYAFLASFWSDEKAKERDEWIGKCKAARQLPPISEMSFDVSLPLAFSFSFSALCLFSHLGDRVVCACVLYLESAVVRINWLLRRCRKRAARVCIQMEAAVERCTFLQASVSLPTDCPGWVFVNSCRKTQCISNTKV